MALTLLQNMESETQGFIIITFYQIYFDGVTTKLSDLQNLVNFLHLIRTYVDHKYVVKGSYQVNQVTKLDSVYSFRWVEPWSISQQQGGRGSYWIRMHIFVSFRNSFLQYQIHDNRFSSSNKWLRGLRIYNGWTWSHIHILYVDNIETQQIVKK